jgi:hypothetical protein
VAYLTEDEIFTAYDDSTKEADIWREDYPEYERLADNGLLDELDENLPEVNDGSLAASLFKLAKRVLKKKLGGRAQATDADDAWVTELANIEVEYMLKNARSKASPKRKAKDAVRKAAIYGSVPIINLIVNRGNYTGSDFIVAYPQDVKLEAGKDSDEDSDILFWDVYYSMLGVKNMREDAVEEMEEAAEELESWKQRKAAHEAQQKLNPDMDDFEDVEPEPYNRWFLDVLDEIIAGKWQEDRAPGEEPKESTDKGVKKKGIHFVIAFQRGVGAPFSMSHYGSKKCVREWSNPDPTGDVPIHYLYCYQDFINPYGTGIVKLAGGTQNVLDYMRKADVLATQLGLRPPKQIKGDEDQVDEDSLVYAEDANWYVGSASVERMNLDNGIYQQLPARISMYQTSLQKIIPMGDTTISQTDSGDPNVGRTPQALKMAASSLSIDDEDFADNFDETWAAVLKSMVNTQFANMQGSDFRKLTDDQRQRLINAGLPFPVDPDTQEQANEIEVVWDNVRYTFDIEIDPDADKTSDDAKALEGLMHVTDFVKDPNTQALINNPKPIILGKKRLDVGELLGEIIALTSDNKKIMVDVTADEQAQLEGDPNAQGGNPNDPNAPQPPAGADPSMITPDHLLKAHQQDHQQEMDKAKLALEVAKLGAPQTPAAGGQPQNAAAAPQTPGGAPQIDEKTAQEHINQVMELYHVDMHTAVAMLEAERQGYQPEEIIASMQRQGLIPMPGQTQPEGVPA